MLKYKVSPTCFAHSPYSGYEWTILKRAWLFLWVDTHIYMTCKEDAVKYADYLNNKEKINA